MIKSYDRHMAKKQPLQIEKTMETDADQLIEVDDNNTVVGQIGKIAAHQGKGVLHRAFTCFLFDENGWVLVTQRAAAKPLWPLYWDAACSSHQWFPQETALEAARRRIPFELGIQLDQSEPTREANQSELKDQPISLNLKELFSYEYHAVYSKEASENEINSIVVGTYDGECQLNEHEVAQYQWLSPTAVVKQLEETPATFAPWFKLAWDGLIEHGWVKPS